MGIFEFKQRFGQKIDLKEVQRDFINKVNHYLLQYIDRWGTDSVDSNKGRPLFNFICLELNKEPRTVLNVYNSEAGPYDPWALPHLQYFTKDAFELTLLVVELLYEYFSESDIYQKEVLIKRINDVVEDAIVQPVSLGIIWRNGKFYPEGAEELSERLVNEVLLWLDEWPKTKSLFNNALDHYSQSIHNDIKRKDVISNAFQAVEALARVLLKNDKPFDNNFNELISVINLDKRWGNILNHYKEMSKELGRHPGRHEKYIPTQSNTEAFLYLSGLLLRLIIKSLHEEG